LNRVRPITTTSARTDGRTDGGRTDVVLERRPTLAHGSLQQIYVLDLSACHNHSPTDRMTDGDTMYIYIIDGKV